MFRKEIGRLSHNAVPGAAPGNITYFINPFGRVSSDHKLTREEFKLVKRTVGPTKRAKMRRWNKWKSRAFKLILVAATLGAEWSLRHLG